MKTSSKVLLVITVTMGILVLAMLFLRRLETISHNQKLEMVERRAREADRKAMEADRRAREAEDKALKAAESAAILKLESQSKVAQMEIEMQSRQNELEQMKRRTAEMERELKDFGALNSHAILNSMNAAKRENAELEAMIAMRTQENAELQNQIRTLRERQMNFMRPEMPVLQWPPPRASSSKVLPQAFFNQAASLADYNDKLVEVLDGMRYDQRSYYSVPNGFAIATQLEQFDRKNGKSMPEPERWAAAVVAPPIFSLLSYLKALLTAPTGNFRVIVFVVTDQPFEQDQVEVTKKEAEAWTTSGFNTLPPEMARQSASKDTKCTVLIYEFSQKGTNGKALIKRPGLLTAAAHLEKANLYPVNVAALRPRPQESEPPASSSGGTDPLAVDPFAPAPGMKVPPTAPTPQSDPFGPSPLPSQDPFGTPLPPANDPPSAKIPSAPPPAVAPPAMQPQKKAP